MFVVLNLDLEEMEKRVSARHEGDQQMVEMMKVSTWSIFLAAIVVLYVSMLVYWSVYQSVNQSVGRSSASF